MNSKRLAPVLAAALATMGGLLDVAAARAQAPATTQCDSIEGDHVERILICTKLIQAQRTPSGKAATPKDMATFHLNRGIAYGLIFDFERAIEDHTRARDVFPGSQTNIDDNAVKLEWTRYLKAIQEENDTENWARPPHDAFWSFDTE